MYTPTNYLLVSMAVSDVFTIMMFAALKFAFSQHVLDENFGHLVCKASAVITTFITIFAIVSSTTLLASVAVSDVFTIMMIAAHRFVFSQHILDEKFGNLVCKAAVLITAFAIVSAITLTVLAVERYNALLKPLRTGLRLNKDNVKKAIALIWMTSVLVSFPSVFFQEFEPVRSVCVGPRDSNIDLALKIYLILHAAMLLIQSVVMVFCYGSLLRGLYFTNTQFAQKLKPPMAREARRRRNLLSHSF